MEMLELEGVDGVGPQAVEYDEDDATGGGRVQHESSSDGDSEWFRSDRGRAANEEHTSR